MTNATLLLRAGLLAGAALLFLLDAGGLRAQADTTMAQDGLYNRPFIGSVASTSLGGYVEGNTNYFVEDGVSEGFSSELRRFNVFLFSQLSQRIRFISELEFEHGTEEIALETALIDVQLNPGFVVRTGILLPPIGYLNQNHDSPRWEHIDRPLVTTGIVPSTLSEVGFGAHGKFPTGRFVLSYDAYVTNGIGANVVGNETGRTDIPSGKSAEAFAEDNNGSPAFSARIAARRTDIGEVGLSWYGGHYNSFRLDGVEVDDRRWLRITAVDFGGTVGPAEIRGEVAFASIDVPQTLGEIHGDSQWGGHLDVIVPLWEPAIRGYPDAVVAAGIRLEAVDFNRGTFQSTGLSIGDEVTAVVPTLSFRPTPGTVFRANYRYHWTTDFQGNEAARLAGFQFGFATYF